MFAGMERLLYPTSGLFNSAEEFSSNFKSGRAILKYRSVQGSIYLVDNHIIAEYLIIPFISILILIFAEVLPKTISTEYSNTSLLVLTPLLYFFKYLFYPLILLLTAFNFITKGIGEEKKITDDEERDDLEHVYKEASEMDIVEEEQKENEQENIERICRVSRLIKCPLGSLLTPFFNYNIIN